MIKRVIPSKWNLKWKKKTKYKEKYTYVDVTHCDMIWRLKKKAANIVMERKEKNHI